MIERVLAHLLGDDFEGIIQVSRCQDSTEITAVRAAEEEQGFNYALPLRAVELIEEYVPKPAVSRYADLIAYVAQAHNDISTNEEETVCRILAACVLHLEAQ